jgi:transposase
MREQREQVTLNRKEQKRLKVLNDLESRTTTIQKASELLGLSLRHVYRLQARYRLEGAAALAHGNRERTSHRRLPTEVRDKIIELTREEFSDYNDYHLTDILTEEYGIQVSRSSVRRLRRREGLSSPRKRRAPQHRSRRERYPRPGMLLQIDGSDHDWLEDRGPGLTLIAAIDDATSEVPYALFRPEEDAVGYFCLLRAISQTQGLPLALYADRHTIFQSPKKATIEQELAGERPRSQFGRLVDELGIELIPSYSPQARGRIERLFGTLQDRLVKELRRAGAATLEEADDALRKYLPRFNARFAQEPADPEWAYLQWPTELDPEAVFCFKHQRTVANDNTVSFSGHPLQIPPDRHRANYARCRVEVRQQLDGGLSIAYQGRVLISFAPEEPGLPRMGKFTPASKPARKITVTKPVKRRSAKPKSRQPWKPPADHPWRKPFKNAAKSPRTMK